jgi:3-ketosteroid 9alpha-monooxygenase subunit B
VVQGAVEMRVNDVLEDDEVTEGWVLTCQAFPVTPVVEVVYE